MTNIDLPDWCRNLFDEDARYFALVGGRGSGKSYSVAACLVLRAAAKPLRILCAREIQKSIKDSVKRLLDDTIERCGLSDFFVSTETEIRGRNGSLFLFAGVRTNIDSIKSMEGIDVCWVEESQTVSQASLDILIPTIRKPGSQIYFTWNPKNPTDPIDVMFCGEEKPPKTIFLRVNYDLNPWFPDVLRAELEYDQRRDPDKYTHIWLGGYVANSEARVFRNWRVEDFEAPADAVHRFGADFGFAVDPTVLVRCHIIGRTIYVDYEAFMIGCEIVNTPELFLTIPEAEKWPIVADSARPETISHLRNHGFPRIMAAVKGQNSVTEGIEWLKSYDIVVHPRCQHTIDELTSYSYKVDPLTGSILPVLSDNNNHCIAEGELVWTDRGYVPIETVTVDDRVMTRNGYRRVLFSDQTDADRDTVLVKYSGGNFRCTPDHEVWVENKGMTRADALRYGDELVIDSSWKKLNGTDGFGVAKPQRGISALTGISIGTTAGFIGKFGSIITAPFQGAGLFTTWITTLQTIIRTTLNVSPVPSMVSATNGARPAVSMAFPIWIEFARLPKLGTQAQKELPNIARLARWPTRHLGPRLNRVANAALNFFRANWETSISFVRTSAKLLGAGLPGLTTSTGLAPAAMCFESTVTPTSRIARGRVETVSAAGKCARVYDLTVEEDHEFFVNGVLVSNCIDALRYACEAARRAPVRKAFDAVPLPVASPFAR